MEYQFELNEKQIKKFEEWSCGHTSVYEGTIGGRYSFEFLRTSIGDMTSIRDTVTDEILLLSEYDNL